MSDTKKAYTSVKLNTQLMAQVVQDFPIRSHPQATTLLNMCSRRTQYFDETRAWNSFILCTCVFGRRYVFCMAMHQNTCQRLRKKIMYFVYDIKLYTYLYTYTQTQNTNALPTCTVVSTKAVSLFLQAKRLRNTKLFNRGHT